MSNNINLNVVAPITSTGEIGVYTIRDEGKVRFVVENADTGNVVTIEGRLQGQTDWETLDTVEASESKVINVATYDEMRVSCTTYDPSGDERIVFSSFNGASGSAEIGVPAGGIVEGSPIEFTSTGSTVNITKTAPDTINFEVSASAGNAFGTINTPSGTDPVASGLSAILNITSDNAIEVTGNSATDTVDFSLNLSADPVDAGNILIANSIESDGLKSQVAISDIQTALQADFDAKVNYTDLPDTIVYIDPINGSDTATDGRGSQQLPYATIQAAFNAVADATSLNQWANEKLVFWLLSGEYNEAPIVFYKRRAITYVGDGAKILQNFTLNYDPTNQYTGFTYTQAGLPQPWTNGFASPTLSFAGLANGMESGFTTASMMLMGRLIFTTPNYTTQSTPNYGTSYVTLNGVEARAGFQVNDSGSSSNASVVLEVMNSVVNGNNVGLTRAGGVASAFTLKAADSRITSVIGPRVVIGKLTCCRIGKLDRTTDTSGTTGIYAEGAIQFTNATSTSGITDCTFVGSGTQNIGNQTGTSNSTMKIDLASWYQLRALTLDFGGGVTFNIMDAPKVVRVVATEGGSTSMTNVTDHLLLDPAANRTNYSVTMKPNPVDGDSVIISGGAFGITNLTLNPNTGQTFATGSTITRLPASSSVTFRYNLATAKWFRIEADLVDVTAIAQGGTNSSTALNNNRVMQSSSGAIVEAAAITASRALISDANGIPTHSTVTSTELAFVSGVTSAIQTQLNAKAAQSALDAHINDTTDAHDASAISYDNTSSGLTATNVQAAIDEVVSSGASATRYIDTFNATTDWTLNGSFYELTITQATHLKGLNPMIQPFEDIGSGNFQEANHIILVNASGDATLQVTQTPDNRYAGKVIIL